MSTTVTMRPRRLSTPAISADDSGTRVSRSGMNTSWTREIGRPNNCPPIIGGDVFGHGALDGLGLGCHVSCLP